MWCEYDNLITQGIQGLISNPPTSNFWKMKLQTNATTFVPGRQFHTQLNPDAIEFIPCRNSDGEDSAPFRSFAFQQPADTQLEENALEDTQLEENANKERGLNKYYFK